MKNEQNDKRQILIKFSLFYLNLIALSKILSTAFFFTLLIIELDSS